TKGPEALTVLTVTARLSLNRRRYSAPDVGSCHPLDCWLDKACDTVSLGVREMACRLNGASRSFDKAADNLARAAQVRMSGELLRQVVESQGRAIQAAARAGRLPVDWQAGGGPALDKDGQRTDQTAGYPGSEGVMVPLVTDAEKQARRSKVKAKRRQRGKRCKPLPRARKGADLPYKEFKIVTLYDDGCAHRLVSVTRGDCTQAGEIMRRDAGRVGLDQADDRGGGIDGADWIKNQGLRGSRPAAGTGR